MAEPPLPPRSVRFWLRAEGAAGLALGYLAWTNLGGEPLWFPLFLLAPDLSMLGYLRGPAIGSQVYNAAHNWAVGGLVLGLGLLLAVMPLALAGAILVAHTGIDRIAGYGLKHPTSFRDTHLGRIGRDRVPGAR